MPKTTSISPNEAPEIRVDLSKAYRTIGGGYPSTEDKPVANGGVASQTTKNTIKQPNPGEAGKVDTSKIPSKVTTTLGVAASAAVPSLLSPLQELASKLASDMDDVTVFSKYYPQDQPLLARVVIHFPEKIEDTTKQSLGLGGLKSMSTGFSATSGLSLLGGVASTSPLASNLVSSASSMPIFNDLIRDGDFLEVRPNNLLSFDYERIRNGIGRFTITLFDPQWDAIEKKLNKNRGYFRFRYGYTDSDPASFSPWYMARAFTYKIDFGMEGNTITFSGFTTGYSLNISKTFSASGLKGESISQIAEKIAKEAGFEAIIVEKTRPVNSRDGLDTTDLTNKIINFTGQSDYAGIMTELCKYAVSEDGQGNYSFFIHVSETGDKEFHFHTPYFQEKQAENAKKALAAEAASAAAKGTPGSITASTQALAAGPKIPSFSMFRNKNSALIRFTPNWAMTVAQITGGGGTVAPIIDVTNKNVTITSVDMDNNPQKMDGKGNITKIESTDFLSSEYENDEKLKAFNFLVTPEHSPEQVMAVTQAAFSKYYPGAITANLEIFGTPNFSLLQKISVIVYKPQGDNIIPTTDNMHWISGYFRITEIKDSIRLGKYTTTFNLISDSRGNVAPDTVKSIQSK